MRVETWACFTCRKTYKHQPPKCPQCDGDLHYMGRYFKPPKRSKNKEWEAIELLIIGGFIFQNMTGKIPTHPRDVPEYLEQDYVKGWIAHWKTLRDKLSSD